MSTVSGEESVQVNLSPRRTRPGLRGRRLVLMCANDHLVPGTEAQQIAGLFSSWRCSECGSRFRKWVFLCAPLWLEVWEWVVCGVRKLR